MSHNRTGIVSYEDEPKGESAYAYGDEAKYHDEKDVHVGPAEHDVFSAAEEEVIEQ